MTLSAKWTAVSFFTLTALAAGSFAFAGCTVTSGNPNDIEGGTGTPPAPPPPPPVDGGTDAPAATCAPNAQMGDFVNATCQAKLNAVCCDELKGCFNLVITADGGATDDCNTYSRCVDLAKAQPTDPEKQAAQAECDLGAPGEVQDAYGKIEDCATAKAGTAADGCQ